jgi:hypothetical protein
MYGIMTCMETQPLDTRADWIDFLHWYVETFVGLSGDSHAIIDVVEKPWNYEEEYQQYLDEGGADR